MYNQLGKLKLWKWDLRSRKRWFKNIYRVRPQFLTNIQLMVTKMKRWERSIFRILHKKRFFQEKRKKRLVLGITMLSIHLLNPRKVLWVLVSQKLLENCIVIRISWVLLLECIILTKWLRFQQTSTKHLQCLFLKLNVSTIVQNV